MKKFFRLCLLTLISLSVFFALNELVFRLFDRIKSRENFHCPSTLSILPYENIRDTTVIVNSIEYKFNSLGMRDREYSRAKGKSVFRILMLGDSIVFGANVSLRDSVSKKLEELLNSDRDRPSHYEVLDGGIPSYNLRNYIDVLKYKWIELDPDMVIIGLCPFNDHLEQEERYSYSVVGCSPILRFLYRHSRFFIAVIGKARALALKADKTTSLKDIKELEKYLDDKNSVKGITTFLKEKRYNLKYFLPNIRRIKDMDKWQKCEKYLREFASLCEERNIVPVIVIFPIEFQLIKEYVDREPNQTISVMAKRYNIKTIDLLDNFKYHLGNDKTDKFFERPLDMLHFNAEGHYLSAVAIKKSL